MGSIIKFLNDTDFKHRLLEIEEKYKNQRIILYGTGAFCDAIFDNFDLSKLNIIAVSDQKYIDNTQSYRGIKAIPPFQIADNNPDIVLITVQYSGLVENFFEGVLFDKNKKIKYKSIIEGPLKEHKYDIIFSLGEACHCASALKLYSLRNFSGPFDWIFGSCFENRVDMLLTRFKNFLDIKYIQKLKSDAPHQDSYDIYENKKTSVIFNHDFAINQPFEKTFPEVKKKYDRRIKRLLDYLDSNKNVLIVYMTHPNSLTNPKTDSEIIEALKKLNAEFKANISILYMKHNNDFENKECLLQKINDNIFKAELFNLHKTENDLIIGNSDNIRQVFKYWDLI